MTDAQEPNNLTNADREFLDRAAAFFNDPGWIVSGLNWVGRPIESMHQKLPEPARKVIAGATEKAVAKALDLALQTLPATSPARNNASTASSRVHLAMATATGAVGGLFGWPALALELPATTTLILRGILDQARLHGHDIHDIDVRLECMMIFSFGTPGANDDAMNSSYFATRAWFASVVSKGIDRGSAQWLAKFAAGIASRLQARVGQKFLAETVPIVGAIGGGAINYAFTDFFIRAADFHFGIRAMEKRCGHQLVQSELEKRNTRQMQGPMT